MDDNQRQEAGNLSVLDEFETLGEFFDRNTSPFFPTRSALDWFIKTHRAEIVKAGALLPGGGRSRSLVSKTKFPELVLAIAKRNALVKKSASGVAA